LGFNLDKTRNLAVKQPRLKKLAFGEEDCNCGTLLPSKAAKTGQDLKISPPSSSFIPKFLLLEYKKFGIEKKEDSNFWIRLIVY